MTTTLKNIKDIALMPLNAVRIAHKGNELNLLFLEQESSYNLSEITRPTMQGGVRLLGHTFTATLYIPQNKLQVTQNALNEFSRKVLDTVILDLGKPNADVTNYINQKNGMGELTIAGSLEMSWRMESSELRPRCIATLSGFVSPNNFTITA